jgi:LysM repeat protein
VVWRSLTKTLVATVSLLLTSLSLSAITPAEALDGSKFDPGLIISDSVFYDFGTMTVDEIQRFLESQVPVCKSGPTGMPCLRNYKADTPAKLNDPGKCAAMPAKTNISGAQIIYEISHACGINPRVLLVTLQKEQGLVQATIPSPYMYKAAMGYGCPDSDPGICGKVWTGLFNQVYKAAGQFQWYGDANGSFTYLKPGKTISISYHPDASRNCGKKSFVLKSQATANLYYYTPFTPNLAALNNLRGSGDSCSAYGNRNFWRFYWDWFGSPIGGGFLLKSSTSDPYFISNDIKYPITDPDLVDDLAPLGPLGEISTEYLNSFKTGIPMTRLIKTAPVNNTSTYFFVSGGKKYWISSCEQATTMGLDCAAAVQLTQVQLDALPTGQFRTDITGVVKNIPVAPATTSYFLVNATTKFPLDCARAPSMGFSCDKAVATADDKLAALTTVRFTPATLGISQMIVNPDGTRYYISEGTKREVLDDISLTDKNITYKAASPLTIDAYSYLPWGPPIAKEGSLITNRDTNHQGVIVGGKYLDIQPETSADVDFSKWFRKSTGSLSSLALSNITAVSPVTSLVIDEDTNRFAFSDEGLVQVTDTADWVNQATPVTNAFVAKVNQVSGKTIKAVSFIKAKGESTIYRLKVGLLRSTFNSADREKLLEPDVQDPGVVIIAPSALNLIPKSVMVLPAGVVVKNKKTGVTGIIDGESRLVVLGEQSAKLAVAEPRSLTPLQLAGYGDTEELGPFKIRCKGWIYIVSDTKLHKAETAVAKDYPNKATSLGDANCSIFAKDIVDVPIGHYVGLKTTDSKTKKTKYKAYKISKGKKLPFKNLAEYKADNLADPAILWVSQSFLDQLPTGPEVVVPQKPITPEPQPNSYTIKAGDSLSSIAVKYKTTVQVLMKLNSITNANLISIGQVIKLP